MTVDEGCVKYRCNWTQAALPDPAVVEDLETWRRPLHAAGLIGEYGEHGLSFGNLSIRCGDSDRFVISGTQTGHLARTDAAHYSLVTSFSVARNRVCCTGPVAASSEALTHAAIYRLDRNIGAIVHGHRGDLWRKYRNRLPTTAPEIPYGTPEMAEEFLRLFQDADFRNTQTAVMGGHEDGLLSYGRTLEEAAGRLLDL